MKNNEMKIVKGKPESLLRWLILLLTCVMMIGNYYCYDIPAALHSQMDEYFGKPSDFETLFSLLYTVYSVPNVILPFFGGYFVDKWGSRICLIVFSGFISAGQLITAFGLSLKSWPIMYVGRVVFGIGGESMGVGNSAILSVWFKGKELAFSFGLNLSVARLGSVINNVISPTLAESIDIQFAMWFGVVLCGASMVAALLISYFDKAMDTYLEKNQGSHGLLATEEEDDEDVDVSLRKEGRTNLQKGLLNDEVQSNAETDVAPYTDSPYEQKPKSNRRGSDDSQADDPNTWKKVGSLSENEKPTAGERDDTTDANDGKPPPPQFKEVFSLKHVFWIITAICVVVYGCVLPFNNIASALLLERNYFKEPPSGCHLDNKQECQSKDNEPKDCPSSDWYQPPLPDEATVGGEKYKDLQASDIDCTDDDWADGCTQDYCDRLSDAQLQAGTIMSIPYIISACLSPVLGGFVDRCGYRAIIATIAPAVLIGVHLTLAYSDVSPVGPLVGQGLAYCGFAAVIWPSVALVVEPRLVGLAYGTAFSIQNIGLATFPLIIASIYSNSGDKYIPNVELFFAIVAMLGTAIGFYLNFYDYFFLDSILNKPTQVTDDRTRSRAASISPLMNAEVFITEPNSDAKEQLIGADEFQPEEDRERNSSQEIFSVLH